MNPPPLWMRHDAAGTKERELRHKLEFFHGKPDAGAIEYAWQYLGHPDRFVRYAARIAIERQPVEQWRDRAVTEKQPQAALTALLALAAHRRDGGAGGYAQSIGEISSVIAIGTATAGKASGDRGEHQPSGASRRPNWPSR